MKRTKIVATLGPATDRPGVLEALIRAGVDVVRINFSHGTVDDHQLRVSKIRTAAERTGKEIGILGDLQGPKIRTARFKEGSVELEDGARFVLDASLGDEEGTVESVGVTYKKLPEDLKAGDVVLVNDGAIVLDVEEVDGPRVITKVNVGGKLSNNKGINLQGGGLSARALTDKDKADLKTAVELEVDYLAISFPRDGKDMEDARRLMEEAGGNALMVAKVERAEAVEHIDDIVEASDVIMVARGDLGVEMGYANVPGAQKRIIRATRARNKVTITATQMMESMITESIPTRAEVSDVANAVIDGTDAVMLSGETAVGKHPVRVVEAMRNACLAAEQERQVTHSSHRMDESFSSIDEAIAMAAMYTANHLDVKAIVALTESGATALWMSRIRSGIPVFAFTRNRSTQRRVALYRGVYPIPFDIVHTAPTIVFSSICDRLTYRGHAEPGDIVIFTEGMKSGVEGGTNTMKVLRVVGEGQANQDPGAESRVV
jgi:pyruvate kinase